MSMPYTMTRPAMPMKDAAEMYSPLMAEAFASGFTDRDATKKSDVVREKRRPYKPMLTVAVMRATIAMIANGFITRPE